MAIDNDDDLKLLKSIGRTVFETVMWMKKSLKPGISTEQLDRIGKKNLARYGARSAQHEHTKVITRGKALVLTALWVPVYQRPLLQL